MGNYQSQEIRNLNAKLDALQGELNDAKEDKKQSEELNMKPNQVLGQRLSELCSQAMENKLTPGPSMKALLIVKQFSLLLGFNSITDGNIQGVAGSISLDTGLSREVIKQLIILLQYCMQFENDFSEWSRNRAETIKCLTVVSDRLDEAVLKAQKGRIAGSATGLAASAMITGAVLAPITYGASVALTGGFVGMTASGINFGNVLKKKKEDTQCKKELAECLKEDNVKTFNIFKLINKIVNQIRFLSKSLGIPIDSAQIEAMKNPLLQEQAEMFAGIMTTVPNAVQGLGVVDLIDDPVQALSAAPTGEFSLALPLTEIAAAIGLVVLVKNAKDLHDGKGSELSKQIRDEILPKIKEEANKINDFRCVMSSNVDYDQASIQDVRLPTIALEWYPEATDAKN